METHICTKCKIEKTIDKFHKHVRLKNGYRKICKKCRSHPRPPIIIDNHKICPKCKKKKHISEYYNDNYAGTGISVRCKECVKTHVKNYNKNHPEVRKNWQEVNKEKVILQRKEYYKKNRKKLLDRNKTYIRDKEKKRIGDKKYRENNKETLRPKRTAYHSNKRKTDLNYKIKCNLRTRIYHALHAKKENRKKYYSTVNY